MVLWRSIAIVLYVMSIEKLYDMVSISYYIYVCICINHNRLLINAIMYLGPLSRFSPWAKSCGGCLNFDCSIILLPVIRLLLRKINNWGQSFSLAQQNNGK